MSDERLRFVTAAGLVIGALLGMAGTFAPSAQIRGSLGAPTGRCSSWRVRLLAVQHLRNGREQLAAGFLVFLTGETLIVSGSAMDLAASAPLFAAGAGLWAAALGLISAAREFPVLARATGAIAAVLFAIAAARMFLGARLTALMAPLPFGAYPFLAITMLGWAWAHLRTRPARNAAP